MASTHKSLRSGTANKRPTTSIADGQIALNTNTTSPGLFFKDSTGATIIKVGPVHVGTTAPNASPAAGGSAGNSIGEIWLDTSLTPVGVKIWNGSAFVNATPIGSTTVQGLLELATSAETQAGSDTDRAVTPAGLQSKVSDSTSTTSSTTIASSTAVKSAYDLANAALPKSGGTVTGNLEIGTTGSLSFEGATADAFETTIAVVDPTADRTITLPDTTGTIVTTGDTGTVTSTMIADGTIVDADISASAEIAVSKLADGAARQLLQTDAAGTGVEWASNIDIPGTLDVTSAATFDSSVAVTGALTKSGNNVVTVGDSGTVTSTMIADGTIVNGDINASAAIAGTKISPDFGSQTITTTGVVSAALGAAATPSLTFTGDLNTGIYSPGADQVAISTNGSGRLFVDGSGNVGVGGNAANRFHIYSSGTGTYLKLTASDALGNGDRTISIAADRPGVAYHNLAYSAMDHIFQGAGNEVARLTSTGRLGIGTSSPQAYLDLFSNVRGVPETSGSTTTVTSLRVRGSSNGVLDIGELSSATPGSYWMQVRDRTDFGYEYNLALQPNGGNVGIGTTSPAVNLHVQSDTGGISEGLRLSNEATFATGGRGIQLSFRGTGGGLLGTITGSTSTSANDQGNLTFLANGATSALLFNTNSSERARIDSAGRWLLGTSSTSLTSKLIVKARTDDANGNGSITLQRGALPSATDQLIGSVQFTDNSDNYGATINAVSEGSWTSGSNHRSRLTFSTTADGGSSPTERARITSGGYLKVSDTGSYISATGNGHEVILNNNFGTNVIEFRHAGSTAGNQLGVKITLTGDPNGTGNEFLDCIGNATRRAAIRSNGGLANFSANDVNLSDVNAKKDISPAAGTWDCIKEWEIVNYRYKDQPDDADLNLGVIAQQVAESCPEVITVFSEATEDQPEKLGVKEQQMYWMAIKALQEAQVRIEQLEARLTAAGIE